MNLKKPVTTALLVAFMSQYASAEDKLKPAIDYSTGILRGLLDPFIKLFYSLFPSFEESLTSFMGSLDQTFPFLREFHWLVYIALFFVLMAILAKVWSLSKQYIYNSIVGVLLLLICIHLLGVELRITLLSLLITAVFGVPGVLFLLIMHYSGIIL